MNLDKAKLKKKIKIVKKIFKIINKHNSKKVIISKELKKDSDFLNLIYSNNIDIIDGRMLFKMYILDIADFISIKLKKVKRDCKIAILCNDFNEFIEKVIKEFAYQSKFLSVVTYNIQKFEALEEKLREEGVIISISNNRRKSLSNSEIILNLDFPEELLNRYIIFNNAVIVNFEESIKIKRKSFVGKIFNGYELKIKDNSKLIKMIKKDEMERYNLNELIEYYYYQGCLNFDEIYLNKIK